MNHLLITLICVFHLRRNCSSSSRARLGLPTGLIGGRRRADDAAEARPPLTSLSPAARRSRRSPPGRTAAPPPPPPPCRARASPASPATSSRPSATTCCPSSPSRASRGASSSALSSGEPSSTPRPRGISSLGCFPASLSCLVHFTRVFFLSLPSNSFPSSFLFTFLALPNLLVPLSGIRMVLMTMSDSTRKSQSS